MRTPDVDGFTNVRASSSKRSSRLPHVNSSSSHSSSRSFNPEPPSNRDLSSREAAHGKALKVEISQKQATAVECDKLELRGCIPPELKHDRDVLARASNVEGSQMRGRSLEKGRLPRNLAHVRATTTTTTTPPITTPACFRYLLNRSHSHHCTNTQIVSVEGSVYLMPMQ